MYTEYLVLINRVVGSVILVVTFSLCAYMSIRAWGAAIARALTTLLFAVVAVSVAAVLVRLAHDSTVIEWLLRGVWVGILLVPASLVHMVSALAAQVQTRPMRTWQVLAVYVIAAVGALAALLSDTVISMPFRTGLVPALTPQWGFPIVASLAFGLTTWGWIMLWVLRQGVYTSGLRRRLGYMLAGWYGPLFLTFPVLSLLPDTWLLPSALEVGMATLAAPVAGILTVVLAYSATFVGTPQPDRLVKHDFVRWWLYGPFIGISIILFLQVVPVVAGLTRLPVEIWSIFGIMTMTVVMPVVVAQIRPFLDRLIYENDQEEIDYLRALPRTAFTQADLRRFLENTLTVICGATKSESAFVAAPDEYGIYTIKMLYGARRAVRTLFDAHPLDGLIALLSAADTAADTVLQGYAFALLRDPEHRVVGVLGWQHRDLSLAPEVLQLRQTLTQQIEHALVMYQMQQRLFDTLRTMAPEMTSLQRVSSRLEQASPEALGGLADDVAMLPEYTSLVRDALTHFWGGPRLSDSPLLALRTVKRHIDESNLPPAKALQQVLRDAIETLKPAADASATSNEAILYNILDMRFIQGRKIRDIAQRLALSESDLYRKQRIAIEEVARYVSQMEETHIDRNRE